jgi:nucleoside-diphosphate-sugar epimerase
VILKDSQGRPWKKHMADVRDIVHGCVCALGKDAAIGETFQLGAPEPFTWDQVIPYLSERLDISYIEAETSGVPTFYEFDISKSRELIGFDPKYDIIRMIDDAIEFRAGREIGVLFT